MSSDTGTRRLQTVMFTDIKDFSAMMSADEQATVELVLEHRETVRTRLAEFGGVEHETIGDAFLTLFDSPVNATNCAVAIQKDLAARNEGRPANRQVWLRIGLHLGDIIHREGGIYGDGVNAAARIEGCAPAGGVCLSEQVRLQIQGRVDLETELLPDVELKGIAHPPPVYRLVLETERGLSGTERASRSLRYGKQLVAATAALVCLVAVAFAINGGQSKAKGLVDDAAQRGTALSNAAAPIDKHAQSAVQADNAHAAATLAKAALDAAARTAAAEKQARLARARVEAMSETMHNAAKVKVAQAMKASGPARVRLLGEALALDPDNAALAQLLMTAKADVQRRAVARRARSSRKKPTSAAGKTAPQPVAPHVGTTIQPRVVED